MCYIKGSPVQLHPSMNVISCLILSLQLLISDQFLYCSVITRPSTSVSLLSRTTQLPVSIFIDHKPAKWTTGDKRQHDTTTALVHFIAEDLQALSVVDSPAFKKFVEKLNPAFTIPTRKTISTKHLPEIHSILQQKLKSALRKADHVCLTIDIWTSRDMRSYLGVTCHYTEAMQLRSGMEIFQLEEDSEEHDEEDGEHASVERDADVFRFIPGHFGCFCHTIQLIVKDALKEAAAINKVIAKMSRLVKHVRHSTIASELLEDDYKLVTACAPRWNTQLAMLRSVLKLKSSSLDKLDSEIRPTKYELKLMSEVTDMLSPFETATLQAEGQNKVTASLVIVCIRCLKMELAELSEKYDSRFVSTLQASTKTRLSRYESLAVFTHASALDPRWKLNWATEIQQSLITKATALLVPEHIEPDDTAPPPAKKTKLFRHLPSTTSVMSTSSTLSVATQVQTYLTEPCLEEDADPLRFWRNRSGDFPQLATLACRYLSVPASSAPVERIFSIAGKIFRPDRCSLSDKRFEHLMFVRTNKDL